MTAKDLKDKITELAQEYASVDEKNFDDFCNLELIEWKANKLIIEYCESNGYMINGFPTEKKKLSDEELDDEDYFSPERYELYLDMLTNQKEDIAEIMWHFTNSFWPNTFESKQEFLDTAIERVESGSYYSIKL